MKRRAAESLRVSSGLLAAGYAVTPNQRDDHRPRERSRALERVSVVPTQPADSCSHPGIPLAEILEACVLVSTKEVVLSHPTGLLLGLLIYTGP